MSTNPEKIFEHYLDFFPEIRSMVIDEMEPDDRCRFTRCSKLSNKEVKASKNYIYSLQIYTNFDNFPRIRILHSKYRGFKLEFRNHKGNKFIKCIGENKKQLWTKGLDKSIDVSLHAAEYFKNLLKIHQNKIKELSVTGEVFQSYDLEIENLYNLEKLYISDEMDVLQFLSKLRRPLIDLRVGRCASRINLADFEQIYQVQYWCILVDTKLTYAQMLRLSAPCFSIPIGNITEIEICNFIRFWQNDTLGKELNWCDWRGLKEANFNIPKLIRLLGSEDSQQKYMDIKHSKIPGKCALVMFTHHNQISLKVSYYPID